MSQQSLKILVTGGTGFIGSRLVPRLQTKGHSVTILSRTAGAGKITWDDVKNGQLPTTDAIVNLAGAPIIDKSWTPDRKKVLMDSRVGVTKLLAEALEKQKKEDRPKVFVSGSAIGIYPNSDQPMDESFNGQPDNFSAELCREWERAALTVPLPTRTVLLRIGIVLGEGGGALSQMLPPFRFGLGGPIGSGQQYQPWIHIDDMCKLIEASIENEKMKGVYNAVSPGIVRNGELSRTIADTLGRPMFLWVPEILMKVAFQERASLVTEGPNVVPKRTLESGFTFDYPTIQTALKQILNK